ncbi:hypothetical protein G7046_g5000 [Stylonectria norvegica]|nr:hypothetical protein G7046_g5000 [Stylonectria norvegica]
MHLSSLIGAVGLLSTAVNAAPRGSESSQAHTSTTTSRLAKAYEAPEAFKPRVAPRSETLLEPLHLNNGTNSSSTTTRPSTSTVALPITECPTNSVFISVTTIDVTVYVTATEPCDDDTSAHHTGTMTMTEHCTGGGEVPCSIHTTVSDPGNSTVTRTGLTTVDTTLAGNHTRTTITSMGPQITSTEPCDDETITPPPFNTKLGNGTTMSNTLSSTFHTTISGNHTTITSMGPQITSTEPCDDETITPPPFDTKLGNGTTMSNTLSSHTTVSGNHTTEPCDDDMTHIRTIVTFTGTTTEPCSDDDPGSTHTKTIVTFTGTTTEPCDDDMTSIGVPTSKHTSMPHYSNSSMPCDDESTTHSVTPFTTPASSTASTTTAKETCVIDTSMTPVSTATMSMTMTSAAQPSQTICEHNVQPGPPTRDSVYCGINAAPVGTYFIAEFIEDRSGVPVSLEGCYQFCDSVMEATRGCQAYRFYHNNLGAPRCDLYGMPVSYDVRELDATQPDKWFDLACGSPTADAWHQNPTSEHRRAALRLSVGA